MSLTFGSRPQQLTVLLTAGADFTATLRSETPWPVGTTARLILDGVTITAVLDGADLRFTWTDAQVDAYLLAHPGTRPALLWHALDGIDTLWAKGSVLTT